MNRFLIRLFLVTALLCNCLGSGAGVRVQGFVSKDKQKSEHQIKQRDGYLKAVAEEPQSPVEVVFRSAPSSHRVASNRPTRLVPTHGGKPGKYHGRWAADEICKPFNCALLQPCRGLYSLRIVATPPRFYYIIALRRILC